MNVLTPANGSGPATAGRRTPTAARRGLTPIAGRRDLRTTPPESGTRISLRALLEAGGAAAAVLYVILSVYYDRFYSRLGIEPGDVGLDRTAIISRAVGGVIALDQAERRSHRHRPRRPGRHQPAVLIAFRFNPTM